MQGKQILMIDDDEDLSFVICEMLENYGYQVTCTGNTQQAFDLLEGNTYHLILLDINLPDGTGGTGMDTATWRRVVRNYAEDMSNVR